MVTPGNNGNLNFCSSLRDQCRAREVEVQRTRLAHDLLKTDAPTCPVSWVMTELQNVERPALLRVNR